MLEHSPRRGLQIQITDLPLQMVRADALAYGAKDSGEMGGGAAAAILQSAGPDILQALRQKLSCSNRQVGDAVWTEAFKLQNQGVRAVIHIISIIKHTPQGAYCPCPEKLAAGVRAALDIAAGSGCHSIAFSALGTGEGRVPPGDAARYMLSGINDFIAPYRGAPIQITFSLPSARDREAFRTVMRY